MKKTALLAVLVLALSGSRLESGIERAGNGAAPTSDIEGGVGFESGIFILGSDARTRVPFSAEYENLIGGFFTCTGFRLSIDGPRLLTKDTEQCTMTDLSTFPPGTYRGAPYYFVNGSRYTWFSDYDGVTAMGINLIVTDNGDGTGHVDIDAYYP